ncbi:MAG: arginine--tRNA ligase [bacterium]|nr:arginine--tRNA ligase [bacterium]
MEKVAEIIKKTIEEKFNITAEVALTRPRPEFGDFATNIAMQLAGKLSKNPREIAEVLANELSKNELFENVEIAGPGFINLKISDESLWNLANARAEQIFENQVYVLEYSCPNAFKDLHTGHLYQTIYGDVLARVLEAAGAKVNRTSFGGDVGLHVAKCLWGMRKELGGENPEKLQEIENNAFERAKWIGKTYVIGARAYEEDETAQAEIIELNKAIYGFHEQNDTTSPMAQIYWETRQWSFDYFDAFYDLIEVDRMHYYPESSTAPTGMQVVSEQLAAGKLERSEGAIVFKGDEKQNLHTRVFITSNGLPTYETKDIGVIWKEIADYHFDHRILMTGNDQKEYMRVVYAAADTFLPGIGAKMTHLTNGTVRFSDGKKMSSRLGNVSRAVDVLDEIKNRASELAQDDQKLTNQIALGAIKYAFVKYRLGGDIAFDIEDTVTLQGNSGTYIQYAHARACSILAKSNQLPATSLKTTESERKLLQKLSEFPGVITKAANEYMVHGICRYLYELAQEFNRFYEQNRVIGDEREALRLALVARYRDTLAEGLKLLGIEAPERM